MWGVCVRARCVCVFSHEATSHHGSPRNRNNDPWHYGTMKWLFSVLIFAALGDYAMIEKLIFPLLNFLYDIVLVVVIYFFSSPPSPNS